MSVSNSRKYSLSDFFSGYFSNYGRLLLANLFFCIPLAVFITVLALLSNFLGGLSWFIIFLLIPFMSPFFAGLANVCRKVTADRSVRPVKDFFKGIKENWLFYLINSVLLYALTSGMFVMLALNSQSDSGAVTAYLIIVSLTSLLFLLIEFSALTMSVSVELHFVDVFKNSFILIVKGFVNHLKTLFALLFIAFLMYSLAAVINSLVPMLVVYGVLTLLSLPALIMYVIIYNSYQTVDKHIIAPFSEETKRARQKELDKQRDEELTIEDLEPLAVGDPEEYVFLNGKTVKRKTVLRMIEVRKNAEQ